MALSPFSNMPRNLLVDVGEGDAIGVGVAVVVGEGVGEREILGALVGEAEIDGDGVGDGVVTRVVAGVPLPGQVCDKRMPESTPLIVANVPACTIRIRSLTNVYV